ncbi:MAG: STAS domain-containing protein [Bacteroidota bacterium]|nr:STAS domain-containing protein [Bacteroidota bacterium]
MVNFEFDKQNYTLTCFFSGRLDTQNSYEMESEIEKEIMELMKDQNQPPMIIFDIGEVDYIASAFIRICMKTIKHTGKDKFSIIHSIPMIKKTFKIAGLDSVLNVS